jgi:hypothetical protein
VTEVCAVDPEFVRGRLVLKSLSEKFVVLKVPKNTCGPQAEVLLIPATDVKAVEQPRGTFPWLD